MCLILFRGSSSQDRRPTALTNLRQVWADLEMEGIEALLASAEPGNAVEGEYLFQSGVDINAPGHDMTPFQTAALEGQSEMAEFLLSHRADIEAPAYPDGWLTALWAE